MKITKVRNVLIVSILGTLMVLFQNCSQSQLSPSENQSLIQPSLNQLPRSVGAVITDDNGDIVKAFPVPEETRPYHPPGSNDSDLHAGISCAEYKNNYLHASIEAIDVNELKGKNKISILDGSYFVYSSTGHNYIEEVVISNSNGRVIFCGINADHVQLKSGHLELIKYTLVKSLEMDTQSSVKVDETSQVVQLKK